VVVLSPGFYDHLDGLMIIEIVYVESVDAINDIWNSIIKVKSNRIN